MKLDKKKICFQRNNKTKINITNDQIVKIISSYYKIITLWGKIESRILIFIMKNGKKIQIDVRNKFDITRIKKLISFLSDYCIYYNIPFECD